MREASGRRPTAILTPVDILEEFAQFGGAMLHERASGDEKLWKRAFRAVRDDVGSGVNRKPVARKRRTALNRRAR
jgi:hypothetical protein